MKILNYQSFKSTFLVAFLILVSAHFVFSQNDPINVGDNISASLAFPGDVNGYTFCSAAGVPIYIKASSDDISFLRIELYNDSGDLIADDFSTIASKILTMTSMSGEFTILVKSQNGNEQGEYFLSLQRTINPIDATPLVCDNATMNSLSAFTEPKPFTFSVSAGTTVNLVLSSSEINFIRMELFNPSGMEIVSDFSSLVAEIQITLSEPGCYVLFVMSQNCNEMGSFSLAQNVTMGECSGVCPTNEICGNQIDDDGDGLVDCQDEDCCNFFVLPVAEIEGTTEFCEGEFSTLTASGGTSYNWSTGENTSSINVSTAGIYTVTVTNTDGCSDTKSTSVIVNDLPTAIINGVLEFCEGENSTLTASGGTSYAWNTGETTASINVNSSNTYSVVVTDANDCTNSTSVNVIVHDLPNASINGNLEFCEGETSTLTASGGISYAWSTGVNVESINVFASNDYSVTVTDGNGCTNTASVSVIVHDLPNATIDGVLDFCEGENTTLIANGGASYIWNVGAIDAIINVTNPGIYSVTIADNNGCTDSESVSVNVNNLPVVSFELVNDIICIDEPSITLIGGMPIGGEYSGLAVSNNTFDPLISGVGTHSVTYSFTDTNGCTNSESAQIVVIEDCISSLSTLNPSNIIEIYPNPSNGEFIIKLNELQDKVSMQLFDVRGQEIRIDENSNEEITVKDLAKGIYFFRIVGDGFQFANKIIIQ